MQFMAYRWETFYQVGKSKLHQINGDILFLVKFCENGNRSGAQTHLRASNQWQNPKQTVQKNRWENPE